jgi:phosphopantetheinyl transferase (holo-ACP synthase)
MIAIAAFSSTKDASEAIAGLSSHHYLIFSGPAQERATKRGITSALITLSHTDHHSMACVVLDGKN